MMMTNGAPSQRWLLVKPFEVKSRHNKSESYGFPIQSDSNRLDFISGCKITSISGLHLFSGSEQYSESSLLSHGLPIEIIRVLLWKHTEVCFNVFKSKNKNLIPFQNAFPTELTWHYQKRLQGLQKNSLFRSLLLKFRFVTKRFIKDEHTNVHTKRSVHIFIWGLQCGFPLYDSKITFFELHHKCHVKRFSWSKVLFSDDFCPRLSVPMKPCLSLLAFCLWLLSATKIFEMNFSS